MRSNNTMKKLQMVALLLMFAIAGVLLGTMMDTGAVNPASAEIATPPSLESLAATPLDSLFKAPYELASQSIVGVELTTSMTVRNGRVYTDTQTVGSGVVLSDDGYVVTNYHVVTAGRSEVVDSIRVVFDNEKYDAEYIAGDEATDIAVLKADGLKAPAARIGNSDEISVGDWTLVIGNPLGEEALVNTLTVGVVSGQDRDMTRTDRRTGKTVGTKMIQTNAAVNAGNSGGGMFNVRGELIGITSMKFSSNSMFSMASIEGIGLAIPANTVVDVVNELIQFGEIKEQPSPRMGVQIQDFPSDANEPTKDALPASVWIRDVEKNSPAEEAGLQVDDLILYADGVRVKTSRELQDAVAKHTVGEFVEIQVYRVPGMRNIRADEDIPEGEYITFSVELKILDE